MIHCIIVDDEPLALDLLEDYIHQVHDLKLVARCQNAASAHKALEKYDVQLMFLDINMPETDGIAFLQSLKMKNRPLVVFTTAHSQHALESYELDVTDYLLKPFSFERFLKAIHKVNIRLHPSTNGTAVLNHSAQKHIFIKSEYKTYRIDLPDIIYVEGLKDYSKIYTTSGNVLTLKSLKAIEGLLPKNEFIRVHRSYIIAIHKIKVVSKSQITTVNDINIPISESFRDNFNAMMNAAHI